MLKNKKGSGIDSVIVSTVIILFQLYIIFFFLSAMLYFTLEQQIQVDVQQAVNMIVKNRPTVENLIKYNDYLKQQLVKYSSFGTFKIEYYILDDQNPDMQTAVKITDDQVTPSNPTLLTLYKPNQDDILIVIVKQNENSTFGRFISFFTGFGGEIKLATRKIGVYERIP